MTIQPVLPAPAPAASSGTATKSAGDAGFGELLAGLVGTLLAPAQAELGNLPGEPLPEDVEGDPEAALPTGMTAELAALLASTLPVPPTQAAPVEMTGELLVPAPAQTAGPDGEATAPIGTVLPTSTMPASSDASALPGETPVPAALPTPAGPTAQSTNEPVAPPTPSVGLPDATAVTPGQTGTDAPAEPTRAVPATEQPVVLPQAPAPAAPTTGAATATTPIQAATAPAAAPQLVPVTDQIVERIAHLVGTDGTTRLTLKLQPESLGEVRVVLTVRDGAVQVRFSAGDAASQLLAQEAPELRRLLEQTGAIDTRVQVRDSTGQTYDLGSSSREQSAGTGGDSTQARGGAREHGPTTTNPSNADVTVPSRRPESVGRVRSSGLDLSM